MIRAGFLDSDSRRDLIDLARDGLVEHRLGRRANALVLLDDGLSCEAVSRVLFLDDDTIRTWHRLYEDDGIEGLAGFGQGGSACRLSLAEQERLKDWVTEVLPRSTHEVGAWIERECGIVYQSRSALIGLLHRLGMEHRKPRAVAVRMDVAKQQAFIQTYDRLLDSLPADEAVMFADAVHPTHAARPVGCWAPSTLSIAIDQTSARNRLNVHGALDLETGATCMIEALSVNAASTIALLSAIETMHPKKRRIHVFLDNAKYHHAQMVDAWLAKPECRVKVHFIPSYCPHLNPIERLWGVMHKNVTHNKCYKKFADFCTAILTFLRNEAPKNWNAYRDLVTDNFRTIDPEDFRILK